ncbi:MAG: PorT family protein [Bacteroidetes bacterium]|nr:PorT family protein [Fibrella sp.]
MQKHKFTYYFTLIVLSVLIYDTDAYAQQRFSAGPRLGVNLSKYVGNNIVSNESIAGLSAGAFLMYSSLNHFGISADLLYAQKGAKYIGVGPGGTNVVQRVNYLEIPVALRYFLTRSGDFRPNLFVGPALGFKLTANQKVEGTDVKTDISDGVKPIDLGLMAGFQLNFRGLGPRQRFLIDGRYTYGLSGISAVSGNAHNSVFTLALGYGFGVGPASR